jgi:septation ring formation regulator EzrA
MSNVPQDPRIDQLVTTVDEMQKKLTDVSKNVEGYTFDTRNWLAVKLTLEEQEKRFHAFEKQIEQVRNLVMNLQTQFQQFQVQRVTELQNMVNHGPTQRDEDTSS